MSIQEFVESGMDGMEHAMFLPAADRDEYERFAREIDRRRNTSWAMDAIEVGARLLAMEDNKQSELAYRRMEIVTRIALVQTVCTEDLLHKNHESNAVLFEVLNRFYSELEGQFRMQVQRSTTIRFLYYGTPSANAPARFGFTSIIGLGDFPASCDATVYSGGEIQAINPSTFRATVYFGIRRNATPTEQRNLSEVDKGNTLTLWQYKLVSNMFSEDKLRYTVMDPKSWTQKWPFLRWSAALKMKESQCPEHARVTHPA